MSKQIRTNLPVKVRGLVKRYNQWLPWPGRRVLTRRESQAG